MQSKITFITFLEWKIKYKSFNFYIIFMVLCLFLTRAKSPQPPVDREDAEKKDVDKVRLNPCKCSDTLTCRNIEDT